MRFGVQINKKVLRKAQVILETVIALTMLILFLLGGLAILKSATQLTE